MCSSHQENSHVFSHVFRVLCKLKKPRKRRKRARHSVFHKLCQFTFKRHIYFAQGAKGIAEAAFESTQNFPKALSMVGAKVDENQLIENNLSYNKYNSTLILDSS